MRQHIDFQFVATIIQADALYEVCRVRQHIDFQFAATIIQADAPYEVEN